MRKSVAIANAFKRKQHAHGAYHDAVASMAKLHHKMMIGADESVINAVKKQVADKLKVLDATAPSFAEPTARAKAKARALQISVPSVIFIDDAGNVSVDLGKDRNLQSAYEVYGKAIDAMNDGSGKKWAYIALFDPTKSRAPSDVSAWPEPDEELGDMGVITTKVQQIPVVEHIIQPQNQSGKGSGSNVGIGLAAVGVGTIFALAAAKGKKR